MFRTTRVSYKPFAYPWAHEMFTYQSELFWVPSEVSLQPDIVHWRSRLTAAEKHLLEQVQLYLASADVDIASSYVEKYLPNLPLPEVRSALLSIANIEAIHAQSYAYTIDTLGMNESSYSAFLEIPEMFEKHEFITGERQEMDLTAEESFLLDIAICSGFGEGLQLFSAFALILSFTRRGLMNGMGRLTEFIARDETLHCEFMLKVFNTIKEQELSDCTYLNHCIVVAAHKAVELENHFIDLAFEFGDLENLTKEELKEYVRYIANKRLRSMGIDPIFDVPVNPLPWIDELVGIPELANFFETRSKAYSRANWSGTWEEAWALIGE